MATEDPPPKLSAAKRALLEKWRRGTASAPRSSSIPRWTGAGAPLASLPQQRLWFLEQLEPGTAVHNLAFAARAEGDLDAGALARSLQAIAQRHEPLRTHLRLRGDGQLVQEIAPPGAPVLPLDDLRSLPADQRLAEGMARVRAEVARPFRLDAGPLWRARLVQLGEADHLLGFVFHHTVFDGWSMGVLLRELVPLYAAERAGRALALPPLPLRYADFAEWQRARDAAGAALEADLAYWRRQLGGTLAVLDLPADRPRPPRQTYRGRTHHFEVPAAIVAGAHRLSRESDTSLFMTLLAAYQALLARHSGQDEIVVGSPVANRTVAELHDLVGVFINTLPLRGDLSGDPSFREILARARRVTLEAYEHQDAPVERLVESLAAPRDLARTPLFQTVLVLQNSPVPATELPGVRLSPVEVETGTAQLDLSLYLTETPRGLSASLEYSTDLFDHDTAVRLADQYVLLLAAAIDRPDTALSRLPLLSPEAHAAVWRLGTGPARAWPEGSSVPSLFAARAREAPDAVAVVAGAVQLTYRELDARVEALARELLRRGVTADVTVGVCLERSAAVAVALLAVLRAGGAYVPLDPSYPEERLRFMASDARAAVVLADAASRDLVEPWGIPVLLVEDRPPPPDRTDPVPWRWASEQLAYVLYTSGSSGVPKGVEISHGALQSFILSMTEAPGLAAGDRLLMVTSISFDIAGLELFLPLTTGATVIIADRESTLDGARLIALLHHHRVTVMQATPSTWQLVLDAGWSGAPALTALCGGEAMPPALAARLAPRVRRLWNLYGPTETTIWSSLAEIAAGDSRITIGRPIHDTLLCVLDEAMAPVPVGVAGELYIGGAGLARGYRGRPELTAARFVTHPEAGRLYRTGDRARRLADGRFEYLGRLDHQVKIRGYRIEPAEIEAALLRDAAVRAAVAVARRDARGDAQLVAYVELAPPGVDREAAQARLWQRLAAELPRYMHPARLVVLDAIPLTPNGKIDRRALPDPGEVAGPGAARAFVAPATPTEARLAAILGELLGVDRVGRHDEFFALGGHSLRATQLVGRLRDELGVTLAVRHVFEAPEVAALARVIDGADRSGRDAPARIEPIARGGPLPLSFAQQRLWFIDQLAPGGDAYNIPIAVRFSGALDLAVLRGALGDVVREHESLRTRFESRGGEAVQLIEPAVAVDLPFVDLSSTPDPAAAAHARAVAMARRPFDLARAPLWRIEVQRLGAGDHVVVLVVHHIVADAWSLGILVREIGAHYEARSAAGGPPRARGIDYADFAAWQRRLLADGRFEPHLQYWTHQLADLPAQLELPTDRPRSPSQSARGATVPLHLPRPVAERVHALCRSETTTPFTVLIAAYAVLLHRYASQEDLVIGTPVANRTHAQLEPVVGNFVNLLPLRARVEGGLTFRQVLRRWHATALEAFEHQDLPFERLVDHLKIRRDLGVSPVFQVVFVLQNAPLGELRLGTTTGRLFEIENGVSQFDLRWFMTESAGELHGGLDYSADLFDAATAARMARHLARVIEAALATPDRPIAELPLLDAAERDELARWNHTRTAYPRDRSLTELFDDQVRAAPDAAAVRFPARALSYRELDAEADRLARHLRRVGVRPRSLVAIALDRSVEMIVATLAVLKAGAAYVPIDPRYPAERLAFMLADTRSPVLVTEERIADTMPELGIQLVCLDALAREPAGEPPEDPGEPAGAEDLAYVIYTSGSTGRPKGVAVPHRGIVRLVRSTNYVELGPADRTGHISSVSFDAATLEIWGALLNGGCIVGFLRDEVLDPPRFARRLAEEQVSCMFLTASLFNSIVRDDPRHLATVRTLLVGGEALDPHSVRRFLAAGPSGRLLNGYGPTESTTFAAWHHVVALPEDATAVPIGRPLANTELHVLDRYGNQQPVGVPGELYIGGDGLARGYHARPDLTAERFVPDPFSGAPGARLYRTGDLVRRRPDGALDFLGRLDDQVKVRGFRIELGEIEAALLRHPGVHQAAAAVRAAGDASRQLVAYVVPAGGEAAPDLPARLGAFLRAVLPEYMVPAAIAVLDALPIGPTGKVDRRALPDPGALTREAGGRSAAPPSTAAEQLLATVWQELLRRPAIDLHDNFFELGGDSILSIQAIARCGRAGLRITPRQFFTHQTIAALAKVAEWIDPGAQDGPARGEAPLSPIQRWFFEQQLADAHHFNQAVLLAVDAAVSTEALGVALEHVIAAHDAFRLRFARRPDGGVRQHHAGDAGFAVARVDLGGEPPQALDDLLGRLHAQLDPVAGPVLRAAVIDLPPERGRRLALVAHHLVIDAVSWRILLEDLQLACEQLLGGMAVALPPRTTSFARWSAALASHAAGLPAEELAFWSRQAAPSPLPVDRPGGSNTFGDARSVTVALSASDTRTLLTEVPTAAGAQVTDALLAAFLAAVLPWSGGEELAIDLEGHGREDVIDGIDLSRTVGWFTTLFPVVLRPSGDGDDPGAQLRAVAAQLRAVPRRGFGYGLLRWLRPEGAALAELPRPQIGFNYLGQLDSIGGARPLFRLAPEPTGAPVSPRAARPHLLEVIAHVAGGSLRIELAYSERVHHRETIERLAERFLAALERLLAHCRDEGPRHTPADLPPEDVYPLSSVQQGLLFHAVYAPASDVYFNQLSATLRGPLDLDAFRRSWEALQRRHGILRTRFVWEGEGIDEPVQVVRQDEALPWDVIDLRDLPPAEEPARLEAMRADDRRRGFRLGSAPPWRVTLVRLPSERSLLLFSFHHLLLDGWSMGLLCKEVFALYHELSAGRAPRLPPAPPFAEYIRWLAQQDLTAAEQFFRTHLAGLGGRTTLSIELPTAAAAARADARGDAAVTVRVPPDLTAAIRAFARRNHLSAGVVFDGAWAVLLGRYSGEADVTFGVTLSGRPPAMPRVEERVGIFINTLPLRVRLPAGAPLVPWLHALAAELAELVAHAHSPLVQVQQWSGLPADQPLFETIVVYENYPVDRSLLAGAGGLAVEQVQFADRTSFPLSLTVFPHEEAFVLELAFDPRRFAGEAVAAMGEHLLVLLRAMTGEAPPAVDALPLLTPAEERALAAWEAGAPLPRPSTTVHGWIAGAARRHPARIAVRDAAGELTYADLDARSNALARHLRASGVRTGGRVAIAMERGTELVVALLAVMKAGAAYVPLDLAYPAQRLAFMLRDSGAALLLTQDRIADALPELGVLALCVDGDRDRIAANPASPLEEAAPEDGVAYVLYTSGSTGTPKGVAVSHRAVVSYLAWCHEAYLGRGGEGALVHSSISFDLTVTSLLAPLTGGHSVELAPAAAGIEALDPVFAGHRDYALLKLTPAHVDALRVRHDPGAAGRARAVVIGGEALTAATARAARALFPDAAVFNEYGPTEATVGCCVHEVRDEDCRDGAVPIGRPIPQVTLRVLDAAMQRVPIGVTAELYIGGASLADGYLRRDDLTADRFVPDPFAAPPARLYRTGDRVRYRPDGVLEFRGRIDGQVKLRGYRIELGEIEAALRAHPAVAEAVVVVSDHQPDDRRLVAYVVKAPAQDGDPLAALRDAVAERLPDYMVPSQWVLLDAIPLTSHGKLDRARLPRPEAPAAGELVRPRDAIELRLTHIFQQLLGAARVGVTDSFFDLGGHSLLAVRLMARIRAELGRDLPLATLIQHPTVAQLGALLRAAGGGAGWSPVVAIQPAGPGTPFFCVHPAGGNVLCYAYLAQLLGEDRPFYGLQARGLTGDEPPLRSLEEMAALYVEAIRERQPAGPYLVGGWSFGGMAAVEIARQLEAQGEVVAGLFLIDSPSVVEGAADLDIEDPRFLSYLSRFFNEDLAIAVSPDELSPLPREERHAYIVAWARRANLVPADFDVADLRRILRVYEACSLAHASYRPRSLPRHVVVFRALDARHADPLLGWGPFAQAPLVIHDAPGDHVTIMSRANVAAFAATLRGCLAAADPAPRTP